MRKRTPQTRLCKSSIECHQKYLETFIGPDMLLGSSQETVNQTTSCQNQCITLETNFFFLRVLLYSLLACIIAILVSLQSVFTYRMYHCNPRFITSIIHFSHESLQSSFHYMHYSLIACIIAILVSLQALFTSRMYHCNPRLITSIIHFSHVSLQSQFHYKHYSLLACIIAILVSLQALFTSRMYHCNPSII